MESNTDKLINGFNEKAVKCFSRGNYVDAIKYFNEVLKIDASNFSAWNNLGQTYRANGKIKLAENCFMKAIAVKPSFPEPHMNLGLIYSSLGKYEKAISYYLRALKAKEAYPQAYYNLAIGYAALGKTDNAISSYSKAIMLKPNYLEALNNLGVLYIELGKFDEAFKALRKAEEICPDSYQVLNSLGTLLKTIGKFEEALEVFHRAIKIDPKKSEARWNLGLIELLLGKYKSGWKGYLFRHSIDRSTLNFPEKKFTNNIAGQNIKIYGEQGIGDEIFFMRFLPELVSRGTAFTYRGDERISGMVQRTVTGFQKDSNIQGDCLEFSIADLPFLLGCNEPVKPVLIDPLPQKVEKMREFLGSLGPPPYIGFTHRAGLVEPGYLYKEVELDQLLKVLIELPGTLICMQRELENEERQVIQNGCCGREIFFQDTDMDIEDSLAMMCVLDDYIAVSNTNLHLRASVNKEARVLVTNPPDYRWGTEDKSPWFPSFNLYRQAFDMTWESGIKKLVKDLSNVYR